MNLSDSAIRSAKPRSKDYKLFDGGGLYLLVTSNGGTRWRLKYRHDGKENLLALGVYPDVSLKEARRRREETREQLAIFLIACALISGKLTFTCRRRKK